MASHRFVITQAVERQYASAGGDLAFEAVLRHYGPAESDDALAELIEVDGRARVALGKHVDLRRYLDAVPGLEGRPVPLDAAIDVTLRSLSRSSRPTPEAVAALTGNYPHLAATIREAATLADAMWSTTGLRTRLESGSVRDLPADFGPRMPRGGQRYELRRLLGSGGWGEVYLALDRQLSEAGHEALVAVKLLSGLDGGPWARQRLIEEATKARRVQHPAVVRVLDRGVSEEDRDYIVYEYVEGGDLGQWLHGRGPLPAREAALLMAEIARGVQAAHAAGLVHCDLKPGNILMTGAGEPKVADFGIAVRAGELLDLQAESGGRPIGNIAFISPEQFRIEDGSLTVASDIYALGGILYHLLTRALPNGDSVEAVSRNHDPVEGRRSPPRLAAAGLRADRDLEGIVARAMALRPDARYASAAALADDLEAWAGGLPIAWMRPSMVRRGRLWARRNPVVAASVAVGLMAAGGGAAASVHWSRVAAEQARVAAEKTKVAAEKSRVAAEQTREAAAAKGTIVNARDALKNLYARMNRVQPEDASSQMLIAVFMFEYMNAWRAIGIPGLNGSWVADRVGLVHHRLDELARAGAAGSMEAVLWEGVLGVWLFSEGRWAEADAALVAGLDRSVAVWGDDDPWCRQLATLRAAAGAHLIAEQLAGGAMSDAQRAELRGVEARIEAALEMPAATRPSGLILELLAGTLTKLYGPALLDEPAKLEALVNAPKPVFVPLPEDAPVAPPR